MAARHGVSSMVEKPLCTTLADAMAIRSAARQHHVQVLVNYETTWYASNQEVLSEVREGKLGDIRKVVSDRTGRRKAGSCPATRWPPSPGHCWVWPCSLGKCWPAASVTGSARAFAVAPAMR